MQDRNYLLSIAELREKTATEELLFRCMQRLDGERKQRVQRSTNFKARAEQIGAGLLLQLAVWQAQSSPIKATAARKAGREFPQEKELECVTLGELLSCLEQHLPIPLLLEYTYGEKGKPYLKNYPYYFNISHSGEYVFCVLSENEVGADIQQRKPLSDNRIAERFFTEEEIEGLEKCAFSKEREQLFYRLWTRKESLGKLTGEGIIPILAQTGELPVTFKEIELADYQLAVCKWKQELK